MKTKLFVYTLIALLVAVYPTAAQSTAFTYQGKLNSGANPANGSYDLRFAVYDANQLGVLIAGPFTNAATAVSNGLFMVTLDFGPGVFIGPDRWLDIGVRTNGGGAFTALNARQRFTSTPYAITAGNVSGTVSASQLSGSIAPANIGAGTINSSMLAAGSVTTSNLANGAVTLAKLSTSSTWAVATFFPNPTPAPSDTFGLPLAAVGADKVVISAPWDNPGVLGAGGVYLFNTNGTLLTTVTNPSPADTDLFGSAVDAVGVDKVIVGASSKDIGATNAGAAYLFSTSGALLTTFTNPTPALGDEFGFAVAGVGADKVLITAHKDSTGATTAGAAYLYNLSGTLLVTITNPAPAAGDDFGYQAVAVGADKVLISAVFHATNAGAAYLFSTNGSLLTTFTNPMPTQLIAFGLRIAAAGADKVLITAASDFTNGVVFLYNINGTLVTTFGPVPWMGVSLGLLNPDKVAIGAPGADLVYLFNTNGAFLATIANPNPVNTPSFGYALAVTGDKLLIGVPEDNTGAAGSGAAYLFGSGAQYVPGLISQGVLDGSITTASLRNSAVTSSKIADGTIATVDLADGAVTDEKIGSLDGSKLTGVVQDARLSGNVALVYASQTFTGQNLFNNPANAFAGDGGGLINVNALALGGLSSSNFWKTGGNAGTTAGSQFIGTTDNQPLELRVEGTRALRIEPHGASAPSLVGGYLQNTIAGFHGAVVAGGGTSGSRNAALGDYAFVGAGHGGMAADYSAVVAGAYNVTPGQFSFIGSGERNTNQANYSFLGGGSNNFLQASAIRSFIGGGTLNSNLADSAVIVGGARNLASGGGAFIGGGGNNAATDFNTVVAGGANNRAIANASIVGGGSENTANNDHSTVGGGQANTASGAGSTIAGGVNNVSSGDFATVAGGWFNTSSGYVTTVGGGQGNSGSAIFATVAGGQANSGSAFAATVGGGSYNTGSGGYATVGGGFNNAATNDSATVPGGGNNLAGGQYSFAAGRQAKAIHSGTFVWADSAGADFVSSSPNQFLIRASGGVGIGTTTPNAMLHVAGPVQIGSGTGTAEPPDRSLIFRRLKSTFPTVGTVVARTDKLTLERDGTFGGWRIVNVASPGRTTIAATGLTLAGATVNFVTNLTAGVSAGTTTVFTDAQNVVSFRCTFGDSYGPGELTEATLTRYVSDYFWMGTVNSTFNQ